MTFRFSCRCPDVDYLEFEATPEAIMASAAKAEEPGFDAVFVNDHIVVDSSTPVGPLDHHLRPVGCAVVYRCKHDPHWPRHIGADRAVPISIAKMLATIDRMSGGRLIARIGAGWNEAEFNALGVPFHERGARTTEYLRVWQACWAPGKVSFAGRFVTFADMHVSPKPLQQPHPPIWVGGSSDAALRRAAAFAEVWQPTPTPVPELVERQASLRKACDRIGRQHPPETRMSFRVEFSPITGNTPPSGAERPIGHGTAAGVAADLLRYREAAGVNAFQINFHGNHDLGQLLDSMDCFMREVKPLVT
jgi:alkanesulfonate monooxygenase SsuD/methylene tetrahydromethanopterin reductase-like flavin-dependent oxidoreductase (luciferase family)